MTRNRNSAKAESPRLCLISFPVPSAAIVNIFLSSLVKILEPICHSLYVVTANMPRDKIQSRKTKLVDIKTAMHFRDSVRPQWWSTILQFFKVLVIQAKMCLVLVKISSKIDLVFFYVGESYLFLPVVMAKLLRKKVMIAALGSMSHRSALGKEAFVIGDRVYSAALGMLIRANFFLADHIIVESKGVVDFLDLGRYRQKLISVGARYINTEDFKVDKELKSRDNLVGYIGRLHMSKGVMNFAKAVPIIAKTHDNISFLIGGNGILYDQLKHQIENSALSRKVKMTGWLSGNAFPRHLNELKLLVLPSYSEGLPTIILEAMACGTPVLATPVGGVPDVIKDEETGFIMEDNSPECIARNVIRALNYPKLDQIVGNARAIIEREYTYQAALKRYKQILNKVVTS